MDFNNWLTLATGVGIGSLITNLKGLIELYQTLFSKPDAMRIVVQAHLVSHPDLDGNFVTLTNLSRRVALLSSWSIVRQSPWPLFRKEELVHEGEITRRIEPDTEHTLSFTDEHWFQPWPKHRKGWRVIFRYTITGERRKTVVLTRG